MFSYIKIVSVSLLAGYLISRGGAEEQNWVLVLIGLFIWMRSISKYALSQAVFSTSLIWFITAFFALDWLEVLGIDAKIALCLFVALYWGFSIFIWGQYSKLKIGYPSVILGLHVIASEYILSIAPFGGFNWLRISYLLSDIPFASITYWLGISSIGFLVVAALHKLANSKNRFLSTLMVVIIFSISQLMSIVTLPGGQDVASESLEILGIQGGVPEVGLDFNSQRAAVFRNHLTKTASELATLEAQRRSVDLVVWPENSSDIDPFKNLELKTALIQTANKYTTPILFGAVLQNENGLQNAAVLAEDNQLEIRYVKQKLVPFGEYLPFRNLLAPFIKRFDRLATDFQPGSSFQSIQINQTRVGVLICYEVAFDQLWSQVRKTSDVIVVMTNNATYGGTTQPLQQLRITQMQAKSLKVPILIVSTSGVSAYVDQHGEIVEYIDRNVAATIFQNVPHMRKISPATYLGVPLQIVSLIFILLVTTSKLNKFRGERRRLLNQHHP